VVSDAEGILRFGALARASPLPLGEAALVAASVLGHPADVEDGLALLEALAGDVEGDDLADVVRHLFADGILVGDRATYYDPDNSLLPAVLERGRGIPVTLAIVAVDVARRRGITASVVCMPGHVLVGDGPHPTRWYDVFGGGAELDAAGARRLFAQLHGRHAPFDLTYLAATPDPLVLVRLLGNLVSICTSTGDGHRLVRVLQLRAAIDEIGRQERTNLADALSSVGRYQEAADLWDDEADERSGDAAEEAASRARLLRAHFN
jgi:regulator of sirC expression with transglutaminase-like and TPR domain